MAVKGLIGGFTEKRRTSTQSSDNRLFYSCIGLTSGSLAPEEEQHLQAQAVRP